MKFNVLWIAGLMLAATAGQVQAGMIFDNGSFTTAATQIQRNYYSPMTMFENFVLGADATLSELRWSGGEYQTSGTSNISSVNLTIYDDVPGTGAVILSTSIAPSKTFAGTVGSFDHYDYTISGLSLALNSGTTYWFGLKVTGTGANWSNTLGTASTIGGLYQSTGVLPGSFYATENAAFQLYGEASAPVPEPTSFAMWGLGAIGLTFARRKRRQSKLAA